MKILFNLILFCALTSSAQGQADTVFIKYNRDKFEEKPNYKTDTVIFYTPNARQILYGTTILPMTFNQQMAKNYGLYLDSVNLTPCLQELGKKPDMANRVTSVNHRKDSLTIEIKYWGNCCHSFLCDIEVKDDTTINLIIYGYGAMYCDCTCCYGLTYEFSLIREYSEFDKLKNVIINGDERTLKQLK